MNLSRNIAVALCAGAASTSAHMPASAEPDQAITRLGAPVPTTRVLAIGAVKGHPSPDDVRALMPAEVEATVALYLEGKLDQWYVRKDANGVVFLFNSGSVEEVESWMADLPLVKQDVLEFQFIPIGPLRPLQYLTDR